MSSLFLHLFFFIFVDYLLTLLGSALITLDTLNSHFLATALLFFFFRNENTFIQQGTIIKLLKSDKKYIFQITSVILNVFFIS